MKLHCLGTAGYHPNESRHTSCYFLPESGIVLDAGTGIFRLPKLIETETLDIVLTHAHLDHVAGLTFLLDVLHQRPVDQVRVWGEAEKLSAIRKHLFSEFVFPVQLDVQWCELDSRASFSVGECEIQWRVQEHPGGSLGYRLDWKGIDKRLLYLTDTVGDDSPEASRWYAGADLMMHECYFSDQHREWAVKTGHSWSGRVAKIANAAGPKNVLLTHVNPLKDDPSEILSEVRHQLSSGQIEVQLAEDHLAIEF